METKLCLDTEKDFEHVFRDLYPSLCLFAGSYVHDNALAADIVQEGFVACWERRENFDSYFKLKSFLYTLVRNRCLNVLRDGKGRRDALPVVESDDFFIDRMLEEEAYRLFYNAIEKLPSRTREVIYCSLRGMSNREIAIHMNITENSVHTLKKLAYRKLKESLRANYYLIYVFLPHTFFL